MRVLFFCGGSRTHNSPLVRQSSDIEWRFTEDGERVRVSTRTGREIPIPQSSEGTHEYQTRAGYKDQPEDTDEKTAHKRTFQPVLKTFEQDIMDQVGIVDEGQPGRTFWY